MHKQKRRHCVRSLQKSFVCLALWLPHNSFCYTNMKQILARNGILFSIDHTSSEALKHIERWQLLTAHPPTKCFDVWISEHFSIGYIALKNRWSTTVGSHLEKCLFCFPGVRIRHRQSAQQDAVRRRQKKNWLVITLSHFCSTNHNMSMCEKKLALCRLASFFVASSTMESIFERKNCSRRWRRTSRAEGKKMKNLCWEIWFVC